MAQVRHFVSASGGGEEAVAWVAARQLNAISALQLSAARIGRRGITSRQARGALFRVFRGVYLAGSPIPLPGALELAAVLVCGGGTFVSHRSAAALWGMTAPPDEVEVTAAGRNCRSRERLRVHRTPNLDGRDCATCRGIPVTSPARTVIDFAATADYGELERAIAEAYAQRLLRDGDLESAMSRCGPRAGVGNLRRFLTTQGGPVLTRSEAERLMRGHIRAAGLPMPVANARVAGFEVDFFWPNEKVVVEIDGYQFHGGRTAFERDRRKGLALAAAGVSVIRVSWRQLVDEPMLVVAQLAMALARAA